jgi:cytochrome c553
MKTTWAWALGALLLISASAQGAGDAAAGKAKSAVCAGCHGVDGNSPTPMYPKLAGQVSEYTVKQLELFKSGQRQNPIMQGMAAPLSKKDMDDLGAYFASQKATPGSAMGDKDQIALGKKLYRGGNAATGVSACMSCHGPSGHGIPPRFPGVSGQHAAYTEAQLMAFRDGVRKDPDDIMIRIAGRMSVTEIKAVSQYMAGIR